MISFSNLDAPKDHVKHDGRVDQKTLTMNALSAVGTRGRRKAPGADKITAGVFDRFCSWSCSEVERPSPRLPGPTGTGQRLLQTS
eukprot:4404646-Amphidinium_carterae.1